MKYALFSAFGLMLTLGLAGCGPEQNAVTAPPAQWLKVPTLPVLQGAVLGLSDTLNLNKHPFLMEKTCALAQEQISQDEINKFIAQQGADPLRVPSTGHPLSLLISGNRQVQTIACAAYLASTVLLPFDLSTVMTDAPPLPPQGKDTAKPVQQIDQTKLLAELPGKLAIAQSNADVFALIAKELQNRPGLPLEQYRQLAQEMFARLAPNYLRRIKEQMPAPGTQYKVVKLDAEQFVFISSTQALFAYDFSGLKLQQNGITWFGEGKLLGKEYFLKAAYLQNNAMQLNRTL